MRLSENLQYDGNLLLQAYEEKLSELFIENLRLKTIIKQQQNDYLKLKDQQQEGTVNVD